MLLRITNPDTLKDYPHLAPPKARVIDMVPVPDGSGTGGQTVYEMDPGTPEAGNGRLVECTICNARIREGSPHTSKTPIPHTAYDMLTVIEPAPLEDHHTGELDHSTPSLGHGVKVTTPVKDENGVWQAEAL